MKTIVILLFLAVLSLQTFAQETAKAIKFAVVPDENVSNGDFIAKNNAFIAKIKAGPKTSNGFVAVSGEDDATLMARVKLVKESVKKNPKLQQRIEISRPGTRYNKSWLMTEFWIIPHGAHSPYVANTYDCECAAISVSGPIETSIRDEKVTYSANVSGVVPGMFSYKWIVTGGQIVQGQGTRSITVRLRRNRAKEILAEVDIGGFDDEDCICATKASLTTKVISKIGATRRSRISPPSKYR